jgi:hypothetical protein
MAVIAPFEFHDLVAFRERPRHPDGAHRRFGTGADEADTFERGHQRPDAFAELGLERARGAEARAEPSRRCNALTRPRGACP